MQGKRPKDDEGDGSDGGETGPPEAVPGQGRDRPKI